jgi:TatD DNase family protein
MPLIDTHAHLDEDAFSVDRDEVVARAAAADVAAIITIGTTAESSRRAVELAQIYPMVYAAVGIQPNYTAAALPGDWEIIEELARQPRVAGIGETGLDRYWDYAPIELQQDYFARHVDLARRLDLPFIVHCRDAEAEVVAQLRGLAASGELRGVMHSFTGDLATAESCLGLGLSISFAGMVTYKKNELLRNVAAAVPLDRLLVETDAPYLAPAPMRGKRNEPSFVVHTARCLADSRKIDTEELAARTTANARELFRAILRS